MLGDYFIDFFAVLRQQTANLTLKTKHAIKKNHVAFPLPEETFIRVTEPILAPWRLAPVFFIPDNF